MNRPTRYRTPKEKSDRRPAANFTAGSSTRGYMLPSPDETITPRRIQILCNARHQPEEEHNTNNQQRAGDPRLARARGEDQQSAAKMPTAAAGSTAFSHPVYQIQKAVISWYGVAPAIRACGNSRKVAERIKCQKW